MKDISNIQNDDFQSPDWHGEILKEREKNDLQEAKTLLWIGKMLKQNYDDYIQEI